MTITPASLLDLARLCRAAAEEMTGDQLNDWYEEHVGYRLSEDDPTISPEQTAARVASSIFYDQCPQGLETPGAEAMEGRMADAIENGGPL